MRWKCTRSPLWMERSTRHTTAVCDNLLVVVLQQAAVDQKEEEEERSLYISPDLSCSRCGCRNKSLTQHLNSHTFTDHESADLNTCVHMCQLKDFFSPLVYFSGFLFDVESVFMAGARNDDVNYGCEAKACFLLTDRIYIVQLQIRSCDL